jgi:hypothetical protein
MDPGFSPTICAAQEKRFKEALKDWQAKHSPHVVDTTIVPPPYNGRPDISDSVLMQDEYGNLYSVPMDSLHRPIMDKKRWSKFSMDFIEPPIADAMPDEWNGTDSHGRRGWFVKPSSTPRLDALEKQVQYLMRRVNELELEIKQGKGDTGMKGFKEFLVGLNEDYWKVKMAMNHTYMKTPKRTVKFFVDNVWPLFQFFQDHLKSNP